MQDRSPMWGIYGMITGIFGLMLAALFWGLTGEVVLSLVFSGFAVLIMVLSLLFDMRHIARLRRAGIYPGKGLALESDVQRLLSEGYPAEAVRCYREAAGCDLRTAKERVDELIARRLEHAAAEREDTEQDDT